jgi:hypothetical protein
MFASTSARLRATDTSVEVGSPSTSVRETGISSVLDVAWGDDSVVLVVADEQLLPLKPTLVLTDSRWTSPVPFGIDMEQCESIRVGAVQWRGNALLLTRTCFPGDRLDLIELDIKTNQQRGPGSRHGLPAECLRLAWLWSDVVGVRFVWVLRVDREDCRCWIGLGRTICAAP